MRTVFMMRAPEDPTGRGETPQGAPEIPTRTAHNQPRPDEKTPPNAESGADRISGPGPNDLTRGLP